MRGERHSRLRCCRCSREYTDHRLNCDTCANALLRAVYRQVRFSPSADEGIFRFKCWLPGSEGLPTAVGPTVFRPEQYAAQLGLRRLFVAFNGYWPERGAFNVTASFKDLEAGPTIAYLREHGVRGIVLASAGNTARAFAHAASEAGFPCLIVIPEKMAHRLWLPRTLADCVQTVALRGSGNYNAAIRVAQEITRRSGIPNEGGARNVARRDGMGTTMLEYARVTGGLPCHYFQAVGSGTGGIAAYEAGLRLVADGRFGGTLPRLHLVQNDPLTPIHDRWTASQAPACASRETPAGSVADMYADVLANEHPPYDVAGGVRTALADTLGRTYAVTKREALMAKASFERAEGVSIHEAAACACAGLEQAVSLKLVRPDDTVLLNITGGGDDLVRRDYQIRKLTPTHVMDEHEVNRFDLDFMHAQHAV